MNQDVFKPKLADDIIAVQDKPFIAQQKQEAMKVSGEELENIDEMLKEEEELMDYIERKKQELAALKAPAPIDEASQNIDQLAKFISTLKKNE